MVRCRFAFMEAVGSSLALDLTRLGGHARTV